MAQGQASRSSLVPRRPHRLRCLSIRRTARSSTLPTSLVLRCPRPAKSAQPGLGPQARCLSRARRHRGRLCADEGLSACRMTSSVPRSQHPSSHPWRPPAPLDGHRTPAPCPKGRLRAIDEDLGEPTEQFTVPQGQASRSWASLGLHENGKVSTHCRREAWPWAKAGLKAAARARSDLLPWWPKARLCAPQGDRSRHSSVSPYTTDKNLAPCS